MLRQILNQVPNVLTCGRFVLTVIFLVMILLSPRITGDSRWLYLDIAFVLFVIAGLTDLIDGAVARKLGVTSKFGRMVDPLADKVLVCGAFICFAIIGRPTLFGFPCFVQHIIQWSVVGIIIVRDAYVTILLHIAEARGVNFAATFSGKVKVFLQFFTIGTVVIKMAHVQWATWGYWFTAVTLAIMLTVTIISGLTYQIRWQKCKHREKRT